jgi:hypothetical protein
LPVAARTSDSAWSRVIEASRRRLAASAETIYRDDMDDSSGATMVRFSLEGSAYEIDLADGNRRKLDGALQPFIQKGPPPQFFRRQRRRRLGQGA